MPGPVDAAVIGTCDLRFARVKDEFARNFVERGELGAAVCIVVDGTTVVDLAGGWRDPQKSEPWQLDTLVDYYSVGKAFLALLALQLVDGGRMALDDPVPTVWPEFGAAGKEGATLRHALCHRAGVPAIREPLTNEDLWDWHRMTGALAATEPWWEPGTRHAYHTNTYGHLIGEVVRRLSGEGCGRRLAAVAEPLGADVHVGVPPSERHRCAQVVFEAPGGGVGVDFEALEAMEGDARMEMLSYFNPPGYSSMGVVNRPPGAGPRSRRPTGTAAPGGWRACTPRSWSRGGCSRPTCWPRRFRRSPAATAPSSTRTSPSGSGSSPRHPAAASGRIPAASATSEPEVRSVSPIPRPEWPSAT